jgi:hypothetical protein
MLDGCPTSRPYFPLSLSLAFSLALRLPLIKYYQFQQRPEIPSTAATVTMGSVEIPKKHKAAVYDKPGTISTKIEELDVPEPGAGEVLINLYVHSPLIFKSILLALPIALLHLFDLQLTSPSEPTLVSVTLIWASCSTHGKPSHSLHRQARLEVTRELARSSRWDLELRIRRSRLGIELASSGWLGSARLVNLAVLAWMRTASMG